MRAKHWQDWLILFVAGWLFITPWFYGFAAAPGAAWNAWIIGILAAILAVAALASYAQWQQYAIIVLGLWLVISPWVLGITATAPAMWNFIMVGLLLIVFAAWNAATHRTDTTVHGTV